MRRDAVVLTAALLLRVWRTLPQFLRRRVMWIIQAKFTVGVSAVLLDDQDRILLLRHRWRADQGWALPGGYIDRNERLEGALRRELQEETGYDVEVLAITHAQVGERFHVDIAYLARVVGGEALFDRREILEARFFPYAELSHLLTSKQMDGIDAALSRVEAT